MLNTSENVVDFFIRIHIYIQSLFLKFAVHILYRLTFFHIYFVKSFKRTIDHGGNDLFPSEKKAIDFYELDFSKSAEFFTDASLFARAIPSL